MRRKKLVGALSAALALLALVAAADGQEATNTRITSGPSGVIGVDAVTFTFASPEAGGFECRLDPVPGAAWEECGSPQSYADLADGPHSFEVRARNKPSNPDPTPAVARFYVETEPPETTITEAPSGTIAARTASFAFESTQPGGFECRLDPEAASEWVACESPQAYAGLGDGPHAFEVRAVNGVGDFDPTPARAEFAVDATAPETTITAAPSGTIDTASASFSFAASEPGSFECRLDSGAWAGCESPQSYNSLADGPHGFEVRATDAVGNVDPTPAAAAFTVYTGPPPPVAGETLDLEPVEGEVELQCPGEDESQPLTAFKQVPVGCLINTRHGVVNLTASKGSSNELQTAHFWGGVFIASQEHGDNQVVNLKLAGRRMCERRNNGNTRKARARGAGATTSGTRRHGRRLWGSGKGNYTTGGSYGSATVRGTTWLVVDRCDSSTFFKVAEGTVWVDDFVNEREVVLEAGDEYVAKAKIPRLDPNLFH